MIRGIGSLLWCALLWGAVTTLAADCQFATDEPCKTYKVVQGDSCWAITQKFSITIPQLESYNPGLNCNTDPLHIGQLLCIGPGTPPPQPDSDAQCGPKSKGNATCPLNVCCSGWGYCGMTAEFCSPSTGPPCSSNCKPPTIPSCASSREMRKIGYYAGWGNRRACTKVAPHEVDWTGFTGAIFAFATISEGMEIHLDKDDVPLLKELVEQKEHHNLKEVTVAVGGWNFSEDARTSHLFSDMISKTDSRKTFISSVKKFLTDYKLDGIDIDFEYPAAIERNASATDTPNFTAFIKELREALPTQVISCATPAGYWFLKGFEIDKIAEHVTYLNMMSYDYHGPWDLTVKDPAQKPVTNPQTSIRDIQNSVELYMRAGVKNLAKVNLGLAYYGRDYKLLDSKCVGYNCNMTGGGYKGPCTSESGILAQFEIEEELAKLKVKSPPTFPTLDVDSLTWWFDNDGSLVTYDQPDTWAIKSSFAANRCFGGTFIWSVDLVKPKTSRRVGTSCSGVGHDAFTSEKWSGQEPLGVGL